MHRKLKTNRIFALRFARSNKCGVHTTRKNTSADNKGIVTLSSRFTAFRDLAILEDYAPFGAPQNILFNARSKQK